MYLWRQVWLQAWDVVLTLRQDLALDVVPDSQQAWQAVEQLQDGTRAGRGACQLQSAVEAVWVLAAGPHKQLHAAQLQCGSAWSASLLACYSPTKPATRCC